MGARQHPGFRRRPQANHPLRAIRRWLFRGLLLLRLDSRPHRQRPDLTFRHGTELHAQLPRPKRKVLLQRLWHPWLRRFRRRPKGGLQLRPQQEHHRDPQSRRARPGRTVSGPPAARIPPDRRQPDRLRKLQCPVSRRQLHESGQFHSHPLDPNGLPHPFADRALSSSTSSPTSSATTTTKPAPTSSPPSRRRRT